MPTYGNITSGEFNNQPFSRLKDGKSLLCVTCHNVMQKTEDYGRVWEYTTTSDQLTYTLENGGWSLYGYLVPRVYRDSSLWTGPTFSKDKKGYLVDPSWYTYDETAGTVTFRQVQSVSDYVYVTLDYPYLRASSEGDRLCSDCHTHVTHEGVNCLTCHRAHNTDNLDGIRDKVRTSNLTTIQITFLDYTGVNSFADGDTVYDGICEVCHTQTKYYTRDGTGFADHSGGFNYDRTNCASCHSHELGFTKEGFAVSIDSPFDNFSTHEFGLMVKGSVIGRDGAEVGVSVNGYLAEVNGSSFAIADLLLAEGSNTLTAVATDAAGMSVNDSITVYLTDPVTPVLSIYASPSSGPAPLDVTLTIESYVTDPVLFELDYEGDDTIDASSATFDGLTSFLTHQYTANGLYYPTISVTDGSDNVFEKDTVVNVDDEPDLQGIWNSMRTALSTGDVSKAVTYISPTTRESYRGNFNTLAQMVPQSLQNMASEMADMQVYEIGSTYALGDFRFSKNGEMISFGVHFMKDGDGIWRIERF